MIAAREYRFLSPSLLIEKASRRVARIKGAALVHNPALHITALAAQEDTMATKDFRSRVLELLQNDDIPYSYNVFDLSEEPDDDELLAALEKALRAGGKPDPTEYAPVEAMREAMTDRNREMATYREDRQRQKIERAVDAGYILPAGKEWALDLCRKDEASFDAFLASTAPPFAYLMRETHTCGAPPGSGSGAPGAPTVQAEVTLLSQQLGIAPERLTEY